MSNKVAFRYYGGKNTHLEWLLPLLPGMPDETRYVEPFCGSCAVAINRRHKSRHRRIFLNDIDGEVINFFRVLRDTPDDLIHQLKWTPNHETERKQAFDVILAADGKPDLRAAWAFAIKVHQSFGGRIATESIGWNPYVTFGDKRAKMYKEIAVIIRNFYFHNRDAFEIIKRHAQAGAFIYADPPYMQETRGAKQAYRHEAGETDNDVEWHQQLLALAVQSPAHFAISGYHAELYDDVLSGWHCHEQARHSAVTHVQLGECKPTRTECLWTNYNPHDRGQARII